MKLSDRLQVIYDLIDADTVVADIGCDHGQLACQLVIDNKSPYVYACDINVKPLNKAKQLAEKLNIVDKVNTILADGITCLGEGVDTLVIAGMGFDTIKHILTAGSEQLKTMQYGIVQANNDFYKMREFIINKGFAIQKEQWVYEDGHYYLIIKFSLNEQITSPLTDKQRLFGINMEKDHTFSNYWNYNYQKYSKILDQLPQDNSRYALIERMLTMIKEEIL